MKDSDAPSWVQRKARAKARRLKRARSAFDRVMADDRAFFARFCRAYRVRPAAAVEIEHLAEIEELPAVPPQGLRWFALVHQTRPGLRWRQIVVARPDLDCDASEDHARALWEAAAPPGGERDRITTLARELGL